MNTKLLILGLLTATSLSAADAVLSPTIPAPTPPAILAKAENASNTDLEAKARTSGTEVRVKEKAYQDAALDTSNQKAATDALDVLMTALKTLITSKVPLAIKGADLDAIIKAAKANGNNFTQANLDAFKAAYEAYSKELAAPGLDQFQISTGRAEYDAACKLVKAIQEELAAQKVAVEPATPASAVVATPAPAADSTAVAVVAAPVPNKSIVAPAASLVPAGKGANPAAKGSAPTATTAAVTKGGKKAKAK